jgi:hypothetical protein
MKFMIMVKGPELTAPPPKALFDAIGRLDAEAKKAGVIVTTGGLLPTAMGARVRVAGGKVSATDGPFTETKEVVGGFAVYDLQSKQEAIEWTKRFMDLHKEHWPGWEGEAEIRQMMDVPPDFSSCGQKL